ncbi:hypothetical protein C8R45DRAFT_931641 [Mycena sanguinolenta]|nr:hypothetical protein C8R45DRAFT_931641 [Mycena sanguinolenta]
MWEPGECAVWSKGRVVEHTPGSTTTDWTIACFIAPSFLPSLFLNLRVDTRPSFIAVTPDGDGSKLQSFHRRDSPIDLITRERKRIVPKCDRRRPRNVNQGFTADVSWEFWDSEDETMPRLFWQNNTVGKWNPEQRNPGQLYYQPGKITYWSLYSDCEADYGGVYAYAIPKDVSDAADVELIFDGAREGLYGFMGTTICTVVPKITNVEASYSDVINITTLPGDTIANITGAPALAALTMLFTMALSLNPPFRTVWGIG